MKQLKLVNFFILIVAFTICGQSCKNRTAPEVKIKIQDNWKSLDEADYSIQYPDTFQLDKSGQMGMSFILLSKQTSQQDLFKENINLIIQDLSGQNINLDKFVEISEGQIMTMITDGVLIESQKLTKDNKKFQRVIYTGKQGQYDLKWQQLYWVENKKAYILTLTCEANQYENYLSVGENIMKTFTIK